MCVGGCIYSIIHVNTKLISVCSAVLFSILGIILMILWEDPMAQQVKNLPPMQETQEILV